MTTSIRIRDHVRSVIDADGAVLLDLKQGKYFSLNGTGVEIWRKLESGWTLPEIDAHLTRECAASAATLHDDLVTFVKQLEKAELVDAAT